MKSVALKVPETTDPIPVLTRENQALRDQFSDLQRQLEWFKRQIFGAKSERRLADGESTQMSLGDRL